LFFFNICDFVAVNMTCLTSEENFEKTFPSFQCNFH